MKLEKQVQKEISQKLKESLKAINEFATIKDTLYSWFYRELLTKNEIDQAEQGKISLAQVKKLMKAGVKKYYEKRLKKALKNIENVKNTSIDGLLWGHCDIEWVKNRTWGNCPRGEYRNGSFYNNYRSITGCGYDKLSTLTANMFNDDMRLLHYLMNFIERKNINNDNIRERLGYGIHLLDGMPVFDGGVGISSHVAILKKAGLYVQHTDCKKADVIEFASKKEYFNYKGY